MKYLLATIISAFVFQLVSFSQVFKLKQPIEFKSNLYDAALYLPSGRDSNGSRIVSITFYLVSSGFAGNYSNEKTNAYKYIKNAYKIDSNNNNLSVINKVKELSTSEPGPFMNYSRCKIKVNEKEAKVYLSNGMDAETLKLHFFLVESNLFNVEVSDVLQSPLDKKLQTELQDTCKDKSECLVGNNAPFVMVRLAGDIDNPQFPDNFQLRKIINNNTDFIFRMSMDLYLDMLRFKANNYEYDRTKIRNFLLAHDLFFIRYERNELVLAKKMEACIKLLRILSNYFNQGDIFYKDFRVELNKEDIKTKQLKLLKPDLQRDDYYGAKRVKGEPDYFYEQNGLNVYLTNWKSLIDPSARTYSQKYLEMLSSQNQALTLRIYFIIQPAPAFAPNGEFKGVTAYGLKGILFKDCPQRYMASIDNQSISAIEDAGIRRLYGDALGYLNKAVKESELTGKISKEDLIKNNYTFLGEWHQVFDDCESGFTFLAGRSFNVSPGQNLLTFKLLTNYNCTLQPGYEMTFSNRFTEKYFTFPIANATIVQTSTDEGYYTISVKVPDDRLLKMIEANVNSIACQCQGTPRYLVPNRYVLPYPGPIIDVNIERISAPLPTDEKGFSEVLMTILKSVLKNNTN